MIMTPSRTFVSSSNQLPQLRQRGVVGVADAVVAAALRHRHQAVVPRRRQRRHLGLGEVHRAGLDLAHLQQHQLQHSAVMVSLIDKADGELRKIEDRSAVDIYLS